jgi:hypothetical protein
VEEGRYMTIGDAKDVGFGIHCILRTVENTSLNGDHQEKPCPLVRDST